MCKRLTNVRLEDERDETMGTHKSRETNASERHNETLLSPRAFGVVEPPLVTKWDALEGVFKWFEHLDLLHKR